jgi:hypothetical protein
MHDSVARRRRSIFFGGRVALRALWVLWATEQQCALGSGGFRSHGGEDRQADEAGEASWSRHGGAGIVELGFGVELAGRHRSAHEPEAWRQAGRPLAGFTTPSGAANLHPPASPLLKPTPPTWPQHAASISYR